MNSELHLIILWQNARYKQQAILNDISKQTHLRIREIYEITWTPSLVANNFTRFYGVKLPNGSFKEKECGAGPFLLIILEDNNPIYQNTQTSRGAEYVNTNLFNLKTKYRTWTGGGHKIHASNSPRETNHDLTLLLGKNSHDYLKDTPTTWNGKIKNIKQNLIGYNGWKSFSELFYVLNNTVNYIVLRGSEFIFRAPSDWQKSDIDILSNEYQNFVFILNGQPELNPIRPHYRVTIHNKNYYIDVWDSQKNYYDPNWVTDMFATKTRSQNEFYELNTENKLYELLYHCLIHKKEIKHEYQPLITNLLQENTVSLNSVSPQELRNALNRFMLRRHYIYTVPQDTTVYFNSYANRLNDMNYLKNKYNLTVIKPIKEETDNRNGSGYTYYYAEKNEDKFFIKWGGAGNSLANEIHFTNLLYKENPDNFLQVMFEEHNEKKYVAFEFLKTPTLAELLAQHNLVNKQKIILQLEKIACTLATCKVSHRDIRPDNLMVLPDGTLKLIDMQWAVPNSPYREINYVNEHPEQFAGLGTTYAVAQYCWDDMYSIHKLIKELGGHSDYVYSLIGKFKIQYNVQRDIILLKEQIKQLQSDSQQMQTQSINKPLTLLNCWKQIKYPKWFILFLCWFIVKKKNRRKFKKKYSIRQ